MPRKRMLAVLSLLGAGSAFAASSAFAATPISPAAGAVTGPTPTFVASVATGDNPVELEVSNSKQTNVVGFVSRTAYCQPAVSQGRATCQIGQSLPDGTYYWLLVYERNTRCVTVGAKHYCFPEPYLTSPRAFTVGAAAPPAPPSQPPPAPAPPPTPAPTPTPTPAPAPAPTPPPSGVMPRPTSGGTFGYTVPEQTYDAATVVVHYVATGLDAPPLNDDNHDGIPDYVQQIGTAADAALGYYRAHRFLEVPADSAGPDGRPDIYVKHFQDPDLYGLTIDPANAQGGSFVLVSPHLDMSPKLARGSVAITVSHELFHVVQFGYMPDGAIPRWVAEGSATAASLLVYPTVDDLTYTDYFDEWLSQPWRPLFDERSYCDHCYGGGLWWDFVMGVDPQLLPDYFHRLAAIRSTGAGFGLGVTALDDTMRARGEGSLASMFAAFSVAVYRARLHPEETYRLRATHHGGMRSSALDGLAAHYVPIDVPSGARNVTVQIRTSSGTRPRVVLVVGGPKGRIVFGTSATLHNKAERSNVMAIITGTGTARLAYRIRAVS